MKCKTIGLLGSILSGLLLSGCAAFQTSTTQDLPVVTEATSAPNKALITVEGTDSFGGIYKLYAIKVFDNKTLVGKAGPHGKLVWLRDPGPTVISLGVAYNGIDPSIGRRLTVVAGETYHFKIQCSSKLGYSLDGPGTSAKYSQPTRSSVPLVGKPPVSKE